MFGTEGIEVIYTKTMEGGRIQPTINNLIQNVKKQRQEIYKLNEYLLTTKGKQRINFKSKHLERNMIERRRRPKLRHHNRTTNNGEGRVGTGTRRNALETRGVTGGA
jgi:hypothetical protein